VPQLFSRNLERTYPVAARAAGVRVTDGASGAGIAYLGHGLAEVDEAVSCQLGRLAFAHTSQFVSAPRT